MEFHVVGEMRDIEGGGCEAWTGAAWTRLHETFNSQEYNNAVFDSLNPVEKVKE